MSEYNHQAKVVTVSDGVAGGTREDASGAALSTLLSGAGFEVVEHSVIPDGVAAVAGELTRVTVAFAGLVVTTGGTGFAPRDQTPEGTLEVIERQAPGLAEASRRSSTLGALSRGVAGIRGHSIIINLPGSARGATESLEVVLGVLDHALALLSDEKSHHARHPHPQP